MGTIPDPRPIGDGDGDGDRGFRALLWPSNIPYLPDLRLKGPQWSAFKLRVRQGPQGPRSLFIKDGIATEADEH
jgi:hypothetical protein